MLARTPNHLGVKFFLPPKLHPRFTVPKKVYTGLQVSLEIAPALTRIWDDSRHIDKEREYLMTSYVKNGVKPDDSRVRDCINKSFETTNLILDYNQEKPLFLLEECISECCPLARMGDKHRCPRESLPGTFLNARSPKLSLST